MRYIDSDKIIVFPCGRRNDEYDPAARLTTEFNLTNIVNRMVDQQSFVLYHGTQLTSNSDIWFNIGGYLFCTKVEDLLAADTTEKSTPYFIKCSIETQSWGPNTHQYKDLTIVGASQQADDLDVSALFKGLTVQKVSTYADSTVSTQDGITESALTVLEVTNDGGGDAYTIPPKSLIKIKTGGGYRSISIDDGDLDAQ